MIVALSGAFLMAGINVFKHLQGSFDYSFFIFFAIVFIYNLQRLYKYRYTKTSNQISSWIKLNYRKMLVISIIAGILSIIFLILSVKFNVLAYSILFFTGLLSAWYVFPFFKKDLRQIPYIKAPIVAFVWTVILVFIPLYQVQSHNLTLYTVLFFIYFLALAIPFDIKDLDYDEKSQKTIPQIFGSYGAKLICVVLVLIFYTLFANYNPLIQTNVIYWSSLIYFIVFVLIVQKNSSSTFFALIDSSMFLLGFSFFLN